MLIDIDKINVMFGAEKVLDNVSLCLHTNEFVGLIGPNGAGKTTLLKVMLGLLTPTKGSVHRLGNTTTGYIPQRSAMHDSPVPFSVLEVVKLGSDGSSSKAWQALKSVHMEDTAHRSFITLSGGQQQRVHIAKAVASDPSILVLDEPTTGIDERSQTDFYTTLRTLQQKNITIIMVSHDVDTVLKLVTRVVCLNRTILYDGPPDHFEADAYLPGFYTARHRLLHHHHGDSHA